MKEKKKSSSPGVAGGLREATRIREGNTVGGWERNPLTGYSGKTWLFPFSKQNPEALRANDPPERSLESLTRNHELVTEL